MKAGQFIQVTIRDGINTDEAIWGPDASRFLPERWLEEEKLPPAARSIRAQGHLYSFGDGFVPSVFCMNASSQWFIDQKSV